MSRRKRKKMAKVQKRRFFHQVASTQDVRGKIYQHLIKLEDSQKILNHLKDGFEKKLFLSTLNNLSDKGNPVRFNNFAYCMREIITIILSNYSSDEEILKCSWYKNETNKKNGITRVQRVKYAIHGGLEITKVYELLYIEDYEDEPNELEEALTTFSKLFRELNEHTHLREKRFDIGDNLCEELASKVLNIVSQILTLIESLRKEVIYRLEEDINDTVIDEFISNTFEDIDILSTHSRVDYSEMDSYSVFNITSKHVIISGYGIAHCELQYGSGADMRNGIGASIDSSFPYSFNIEADVNNLSNLSLSESGIDIDTSSWYE